MSPSSYQVQQQSTGVEFFARLIDAASILLSLSIAATFQEEVSREHWLFVGASAIVFYYLAGEITGLFRSWRGVASDRELMCAFLTWLYTLAGVLLLGFLTRYVDVVARSTFVAWGILGASFIVLLRIVSRWCTHALRARGWNARGFAIVGVNELGFQLARNIEQSPEMGLQLVGFYDDRPADRNPSIPAEVGARVGSLEQLLDDAKSGRVQLIYLTFPMRAEKRIKHVLSLLSDTTASVYVVPDFFVFELLHSRWTSIGGLPAVSVFEHPFYGVDGAIKRLLDVVLGSIFLTLAAIPMLIIAAAIKLTSPGPVFFRQKRYGMDGRHVHMWKFRSMTVMENGDKVTQATKNDARVTPLGAFLRKTSLDEVPQLFNVLEGSMSLVGPRPHANAHNEEYRKMIQGYMLRHKVKPGITGLAQVRGWRGETDTLYKMQKRVECDHQYIRDWSPWLDLKILFLTVFTVLSRKNAY